MSRIAYLIDQIVETRSFANRLISEMPHDLWFRKPPNTDSNFAWQIGHMMMAQNFHGITVITGRNENVINLIPVAKYVSYFNGMGALHRSIEEGVIPPTALKQQFDAIHKVCLETLHSLEDEDLREDLEPIPIKHPIAETKYEAISWCFKHEMWHCAEMEAIKRELGHPIIWTKQNKLSS